MALIQKMVLILLSIALLPVFLVSFIFYLNTQSSLHTRELNQLEAIAQVQQRRIEDLNKQNASVLTAFTNRTVLRANLDRYIRLGQPADQDLVQQALVTAQAGNKSLKTVSVLSPSGKVIASSEAANIGKDQADQAYFGQGRSNNDATSNLARDEHGDLSLYLVGPLVLEGRLLGVAVLEMNMSSFVDLTADYTGLGETGETMVVKWDGDGRATYVLPLRFDKTAALRRSVPLSDTQNLVIRALAKQESNFTGTTDYRGQSVLATTRYIAGADWGLVVKIDQTEAFQPLAQLTDLLLVVMFILSVVIIFVAFYMARRLSEPILTLAVAADKIRDGDLTARARVVVKDEIGQLAETFNAMAENVEKVDQMKSEFVLLTSHQLRTPATAVKGFMSMLLDGYAGKMQPKQKELLDAAYTENERQISVINSILDVARMEAGEMVLVRDMHDVGEILEATAEGQESLLKNHGQSIEIIKPKSPVELWVDADKLRLVVDNLIHNAIKYSPNDTKITVTLKRLSNQTTIEVRDQGIGIAKRDLGRLFKRFSRIAGPRTANIQGAGLGLYLAQKLVAMHGGKLEVHSREGVGTRFTITLPNISKEDLKQ